MRPALTTLALAAAFTAGILLGRHDPTVQQVELSRPLLVEQCGGYGKTQTK